MSAIELVRDCRVDALFAVEGENNRHYQRVVATLTDTSAKKKGGGDDDDNDEEDEDDDEDEGSQAEEVDDADAQAEDDGKKKKKKRKRQKKLRMPSQRAMIYLLGKVPLVHTDALMRLRLRKREDDLTLLGEAIDQYEVIELLSYRVAEQLTRRGIRGALSDATRVLESRQVRIKAHQELRTAGLVKFHKGDALVKKRVDATLPREALDLLAKLGSRLTYPTTLAGLQLAFADPAYVKYARRLEVGMRNFFAFYAPLLTGYGNADTTYDALARPSILPAHLIGFAVARLASAPHFVPASLIEQMSVAQLIECAGQRDYVEAMFEVPGRTTTNESAVSRCLCRNDVVWRAWRLAEADQDTMQTTARLPELMARMPFGVGLGFVWESARWFQARPTRFGATMFECGEQQPTIDAAAAEYRAQFQATVSENNLDNPAARPRATAAANNDDPLVSDDLEAPPMMPTVRDDLSEDLDAPPSYTEAPVTIGAVSRTHWLSVRCGFIAPAPVQCRIKKATSALYATTRAHATAKSIAASTLHLGQRLSLVGVRASGCGTGAVADAVFTNRIVHSAHVREQRAAYNGILPLVVIVFSSAAMRYRYRQWLVAHEANERFTLSTMTVEQLITDANLEWTMRARVRAAARTVVLDAHTLCEHDMANVLATFAQHNEAAGGELALVGELGALLPEAHHEAGAPFVDMWRSKLFQCEEYEGAPSTAAMPHVRGYIPEGRRLETVLVDSAPARRTLADTMAGSSITRVSEIAFCLLEGSYSVQVCGNKRVDFATALDTLSKMLFAHLAKPRVAREAHGASQEAVAYAMAREVAITLRGWSSVPQRAESTIIKTMPFVRYGAVVARVAAMYLLARESMRHERVTINHHLQPLTTNSATVHLDTIGLYIKLTESAGALYDTDHRRCCFTEDRLLLCVAQHRHEMRAASVMMARDSARVVECNLSNICLVLSQAASVPGGEPEGVFGGGADAEQLAALPMRCTGVVRCVVPRATPQQLIETFDLVATHLGRYHYPPPTMLRTVLQAAHGKLPEHVDVEGASGSFDYELDIQELLDF